MSELHYTYRVEWSPDDDEWVGLVAEFPSLSWLDADPVEALRGVRDVVERVVEDMRHSGETPPEPLAERRYSGKVFVRTSPELHRRLTIEAAEQGVSVNQWAVQKLAERPGAPAAGRLYEAMLAALRNRYVHNSPVLPRLWEWGGERRDAADDDVAAMPPTVRDAFDALNEGDNLLVLFSRYGVFDWSRLRADDDAPSGRKGRKAPAR